MAFAQKLRDIVVRLTPQPQEAAAAPSPVSVPVPSPAAVVPPVSPALMPHLDERRKRLEADLAARSKARAREWDEMEKASAQRWRALREEADVKAAAREKELEEESAARKKEREEAATTRERQQGDEEAKKFAAIRVVVAGASLSDLRVKAEAYFSNMPLATAARWELVRRGTAADRLLVAGMTTCLDEDIQLELAKSVEPGVVETLVANHALTPATLGFIATHRQGHVQVAALSSAALPPSVFSGIVDDFLSSGGRYGERHLEAVIANRSFPEADIFRIISRLPVAMVAKIVENHGKPSVALILEACRRILSDANPPSSFAYAFSTFSPLPDEVVAMAAQSPSVAFRKESLGRALSNATISCAACSMIAFEYSQTPSADQALAAKAAMLAWDKSRALPEEKDVWARFADAFPVQAWAAFRAESRGYQEHSGTDALLSLLASSSAPDALRTEIRNILAGAARMPVR